jgi:hypothetical protein
MNPPLTVPPAKSSEPIFFGFSTVARDVLFVPTTGLLVVIVVLVIAH